MLEGEGKEVSLGGDQAQSGAQAPATQPEPEAAAVNDNIKMGQGTCYGAHLAPGYNQQWCPWQDGEPTR